MSWIDEEIIPAVITANEELFPGYASAKDIPKQKSCCEGPCWCQTQDPLHASTYIWAVEPIPLGKTRMEVPLTPEQIALITPISTRSLEDDNDEPSPEEIELLQKIFNVKA